MKLWWPYGCCPPKPNVCSVVVCPHSAAERRQHTVRHGTCGLRLTQPVTSAVSWCVHITPNQACVKQCVPCGRLCKRGAKDSYCYPLGNRANRYLVRKGLCCADWLQCVLYPCGVRMLPSAWLQPCAQTTAVWPRLCSTSAHRALVACIALLLGSLWGKTKEGNRIKWCVLKRCGATCNSVALRVLLGAYSTQASRRAC